jgi:hypothetical protein
VKTSILALVLLLAACPALASGELLEIDAAATFLDDYYFAYEDCQVWANALGSFQHMEGINRDVRIKELFSLAGAELLILYEDDEVWKSTYAGSNFTFYFDASRDSARVSTMNAWAGLNPWTLFTYDDGQVWIRQAGGWHRLDWAERLNPASRVEESLATPSRSRHPVTTHPNPCMADCRIVFSAVSEGPLSVEVIDVSGRLLRRLLDGSHPAGDYSLRWDGRDDEGREVAAGVYLTRIETAAGVETGRVVLAR